MSYQEVTGTLSPGAHAGSYNGQDAYNDMLVTEDAVCDTEKRDLQGVGTGAYAFGAGLQGRDGFDCRGGEQMKEPILLESSQNHATVQTGGVSTTLPAAMGEGGGSVPMVTEPVMLSDRKGHNGITQDGTATTLTAQDKERPIIGMTDDELEQAEMAEANADEQRPSATVRRLTPLECERLQQLPDGWTNLGEWIDSKGKKHKDADSPRYKAIGNGIALPFWDWLLHRISDELDGDKTLASLFDGVGSFPLMWERINGHGSARWASEIEPFPMAVSKRHFGDEDAGIEGDIEKYLEG